MKTTQNYDNARHVAAYLGRRWPRTMAALKERVEYGMARARRLGWIDHVGKLWGITDKGHASLTEAA